MARPSGNQAQGVEFRLKHPYQGVELGDHGLDGGGLTQVNARRLEQLHRVVAASGTQQIQIALDRLGLARAVVENLADQLRRGRVTGRILIDIKGRIEEVRNPRPGHRVERVERCDIPQIMLQAAKVDLTQYLCGDWLILLGEAMGLKFRSEERRVGKECRCRWWPNR